MTDDDDRSALEIAHDPPRRTTEKDTDAARALANDFERSSLASQAAPLLATIFDLAAKLDAARAEIAAEREWALYLRGAVEMWRGRVSGTTYESPAPRASDPP